MNRVNIRILPHGEGLPFPRYQSEDAAGMDLVAATPENEAVVLEPGDRVLVPTGISIELPSGFEAQVRPRSGLALRFGVTVLNSPGTIDADYRGEIGVILANFGSKSFCIHRGERIAQLVFARYEQVEFTTQQELNLTARGPRGFGSTGRTNEGDV